MGLKESIRTMGYVMMEWPEFFEDGEMTFSDDICYASREIEDTHVAFVVKDTTVDICALSTNITDPEFLDNLKAMVDICTKSTCLSCCHNNRAWKKPNPKQMQIIENGCGDMECADLCGKMHFSYCPLK